MSLMGSSADTSSPALSRLTPREAPAMTPDEAADGYDYPELPIEKRLFLAANPDLGPEFLHGWGEGDGAYDTIRGLLAARDGQADIAIADVMGLVGDWGIDDVNEAVTNALHEYQGLHVEAARMRPVVAAAEAWDESWVLGQADVVKHTALHNYVASYRAALSAPVEAGATEPAADACYDHCRMGSDGEPVPVPDLDCPDCRALAEAGAPAEPDREVFALREAAAQARWNISHVEGVSSPSIDYQRHWRGTAVWLEKRAAAIERGETPDRGWRPDVAAVGAPAEPTGDTEPLTLLADLAAGYAARSERVRKMADSLGGDDINERAAALFEGEANAYEDVARNLAALSGSVPSQPAPTEEAR